MDAKPYVYKLTHLETGEYYFGYREANTAPAILDLGYEYKSSGAITKNNFEKFQAVILAEFNTGDEAYDYEQSLIKLNRHDPLILNKRYDSGNGLRFIFRGPHSPETKAKITKAQLGRTFKLSEETKAKISASHANRGPVSEETRNKMGAARKGKKHSEEAKAKIAAAHIGREYTIPSDETRQKMSNSQKKTWTDEKRKRRSELSSTPSEETRIKLSAANKGKKRSDETRKKMSEAAKQRHMKTKEILK